MYKCYFLLDNVFPSPHGDVTLTFGHNNGSIQLSYLLGHWDDFSFRNFFHINQLSLLPANVPKFIFDHIHMPGNTDIHISQASIDLLKNDTSVYLCLSSVLECRMSPDKLEQELRSKNIPLHKVVVMCSDRDAHNRIIHGVKYVSVNFWESITRLHHQVLPDISFTSKPTVRAATKKFLCLNRNIKPHRIWLMYSLLRSDVLDEGHVSFQLPAVGRREFEDVARRHSVIDRIPEELHKDYKLALLREMRPRKLDTLHTQFVINYGDSIKPYYEDSILSVVTESDTHKNFITEKTYKAIMNLHPFFIIGNPQQHELLRERGYHTFEDLFGVNKVTNFVEAQAMWKHIKNYDIDVLKRTVRRKYYDKLLHNQQLFLSRKISWNDITDNLIEAVVNIE
jgi:hypothetical protein|tara:strand:+ start:64 stop:1248 length:1185 start_codon:yes stop_codon:yes gene_type:complete